MTRNTLISLVFVTAPIALFAQTVPAPVPASEVFTRDQIGRAIAQPTPQAGRINASPVAAPKDDGQWTMPSKNFASTRFSELTEINPSNVGRLQPVVSFPLGVNKGQEAA